MTMLTEQTSAGISGGNLGYKRYEFMSNIPRGRSRSGVVQFHPPLFSGPLKV